MFPYTYSHTTFCKFHNISNCVRMVRFIFANMALTRDLSEKLVLCNRTLTKDVSEKVV